MSDLIKSLHLHAKQKPDQIVLSTLTERFSWQELCGEVDVLTSEIVRFRHIGLLLDNSPAWIIADLAAIQGKVCNIPLPKFFSDKQLVHAVNDAAIEMIISDQPERLFSLFLTKQITSIQIAGKRYHLVQLRSPAKQKNSSRQPEYNHFEDIAKLTYTSGTTGSPRGVKLSLSQIETVAHCLANAAQANENDLALVLLPLATLLENIGSVYVPILVGAQIIVPSPTDLGLSGSGQIKPHQLIETLQQCQPTTMIVPPQILKLLITLTRQKLLVNSFRYIAVGGAPVGRTLLDEAGQLGLPIYQGYGLSEACSVVSVNTPGKNRAGSVGMPLPHQQLRITEEGEIYVRGQTFTGYLNDQPRDPASELATGDLGFLDEDGYLYITGRVQNRIISSYGRNISPEWVESELQSHTAISQAAVLGNDQPFLIAVVVPGHVKHPANSYSEIEQAIDEINQRLPDYAQTREFIIAKHPFTVSNGQSTANGRPRRDVIESHYAQQIQLIYEVKNGQVL